MFVCFFVFFVLLLNDKVCAHDFAVSAWNNSGVSNGHSLGTEDAVEPTFYCPAFFLFIVCVGIIRNNSLVGGSVRAEIWTPVPELVTLYCTWRPSPLSWPLGHMGRYQLGMINQTFFSRLLKGRCYGNRFLARIGKNWHIHRHSARWHYTTDEGRGSHCFVIVIHQPSLSSRDTLQQLHRLPVKWRIRFQLASLTHRVLHTGTPSYLSERLHPYVLSRTLRSLSSANLLISRTILHFGSRSFHIAAPTVWNSLPSILRSPQILNTFRKHLITHLFQSAFSSP